jgi:hypothetical protein
MRKRRARRLPTFLFIGADKSGSTWLFRALRRHPQCFVPAAKDIYFFDRFYERGLDWYASFFDAATEAAVAVGELSHDYLYSDQAAQRIAADLPDARLVVFLRHPVERTFSEHLYRVRSGLSNTDVREALTADPEPIDHSRYARYLPSYLGRFSREQIGVFLHDALVRDPRGFARSVFDFLGIRDVNGVEYGERVLAAARPRSRILARGARTAATLTREAGFPNLVGRVKSGRITSLLYAPFREDDRPRLDDADRRWLHEQLDPDLTTLEEMLGWSLSQWRAGHGDSASGD